MILTYDDRQSPVWKKIKEYAEEQLKSLRSELERDKTPEQTSKLRGQIRSLVLLLSLESLPATAFETDVDED